MDADGASSSDRLSEDNPEQSHVLVVDDSGLPRRYNESMFRRFSCKVTTAKSGLEALEFLGLADNNQSSQTDNVPKVNLIVADYNMPEMTGFDLLKKIKESSTTKDLPVVIASSLDDPNLSKMCLEAGALMFIVKPLKSSDFKNLIKLIK